MRFTLIILLIILTLPALAQDPPPQCDTCDWWQNSRMDNYRYSETDLRGKVEGRVSNIEGKLEILIWLLGAILGVIILPYIVRLFGSKKLIWLVLVMAGLLLFPSAIPRGECQGGSCGQPCGADQDCLYVCTHCNTFHFYCE